MKRNTIRDAFMKLQLDPFMLINRVDIHHLTLIMAQSEYLIK